MVAVFHPGRPLTHQQGQHGVTALVEPAEHHEISLMTVSPKRTRTPGSHARAVQADTVDITSRGCPVMPEAPPMWMTAKRGSYRVSRPRSRARGRRRSPLSRGRRTHPIRRWPQVLPGHEEYGTGPSPFAGHLVLRGRVRYSEKKGNPVEFSPRARAGLARAGATGPPTRGERTWGTTITTSGPPVPRRGRE